MSSIVDFKTEKDLRKFLFTKKLSYIAEGSEGKCFASSVDNDAYKVLFEEDKYFEEDYEIDKIITTVDIDLESFAFPKEIYTVNGQIRAYRTKKIDNDLFNFEEDFDLYSINFLKLEKAYLKFKKDIISLSKEGIEIYDLCFNLIFDGDNLIAIDTCGYKKVDYDVLQKNIVSLDYAIVNVLILCLSQENLVFCEACNEVDQYIRNVGKLVRRQSQKRKINKHIC